MKAAKRKRLEKRGWVVGDAQAFLGLSETEAKSVEKRVAERQAKRRPNRPSGR